MCFLEEMKPILEELVQGIRFSGNTTYERIHPILMDHKRSELNFIRDAFGVSNYKYVIKSLLRNVFLIELVNDDISSTKMETRWVIKEPKGKKQEEINESDPRFCLFEGCLQILLKLLSELQEVASDKEKRNLLELYQKYNLIPYELPLDYNRTSDGSLSHIHCCENLRWIWNREHQGTLKLRELLLNPQKNKNHHRLLSTILRDKLKVKTYLTDRVQTGPHKTNREKRWEVHPESVHFALRRTCFQIEQELIIQLCRFHCFPSEIFTTLKSEGLVTEGTVFRCPVTLGPLSFEDLKKEVETPLHGKSNSQIGHLTPLKSQGEHAPVNVSWFSADGNRIQGDLTLTGVRKLLKMIHKNYEDTGIEVQ